MTDHHGLLEKLAELGMFKAKRLLPMAGSAIGTAAGGPIGGMIGQAAGSGMGSMASSMGGNNGQGMLQPAMQDMMSNAGQYAGNTAMNQLSNLFPSYGGQQDKEAPSYGSGGGNSPRDQDDRGVLSSEQSDPYRDQNSLQNPAFMDSAINDYMQGNQSSNPMSSLEELLNGLSDEDVQKLFERRFSNRQLNQEEGY